MKRKHGVWIIGLIVVWMINMIQPVQAKVEVPKVIRVGLEDAYKNAYKIEIHNKQLMMGYELKSEWALEVVFDAKSTFQIMPVNGFYISSDQIFNSYEEAQDMAALFQAQQLPAYPASIGSRTWKVYIGNYESLEEAQGNQQLANGMIENFEFHILEDFHHWTQLQSDNTPKIIIDSMAEYPQFISGDTIDNVSIMDLGNRKYRGKMEFSRTKEGGITPINIIPFEEYLYGVVPAEMITDWPLEALKAQAVAARTYALYNMKNVGKHAEDHYDLCDTQYCQVYKGFGIEDSNTNRAVDETNGKLIYFDDEVIPTYFFSTSGGHTEDSENVWSGSIPYLRGVPDIYELSPERSPWTTTLTKNEIKESLRKYDVNIGDIVDIIAEGYSDSGRVSELKIIGTDGEYVLKKETMRYWLGLYSRKFQVIKGKSSPKVAVIGGDGQIKENTTLSELMIMGAEEQVISASADKERIIALGEGNISNYTYASQPKDAFVFDGQGWGHGVGMSQSGAKGMAEHGFTYDKILTYYYSGVNIK